MMMVAGKNGAARNIRRRKKRRSDHIQILIEAILLAVCIDSIVIDVSPMADSVKRMFCIRVTYLLI